MMKVVTVFRNLNSFDRYAAQMKALAERVDLAVYYDKGEPRAEWAPILFRPFDHISWGFVEMVEAYEDDDVDVFYALSDGWQQFYAYRAAKRMKKPLVIRVRGDFKAIDKATRPNLFKNLVKNDIRRLSFTAADAVVPVAEHIKDAIDDWPFECNVTEVVPSGVDFNMFAPRKRIGTPFTVGYAGRLSKEKGSDILIEIAELQPDVYFKICGPLQMRLNFPTNVYYYGHLPYANIPTFISSVDVGLFPSRTEGMPLSILEFYSMRKPIVSNKVAFPRELPVYGTLVDEEDAETPWAYVDALATATAFSEMNIRKEIASYTWENFAEKMVKIFEDVV